MKQRNVAVVMLLSLVTFGIYTLFWLHETRKEMLARGAKDIPSILWLVLPAVLLIPASIVAFILLILSAPEASSAAYDVNSFAILSVLFATMFGYFVWYAISLFWLYKYSQAVEQITRGQTSFMLSYALYIAFAFVGFSFIWPGIIQDGFNKVPAESDQSKPATPSALPPATPAA